jgi:branched-chain amino acid transport system permease protein
MYLMMRPVLKVGETTLVDFEQPRHLYFVALGMLVLCYAFLAMVLRSRFGHALTGIRINEQRMRAAGYQTYRYKLAAFVLAGALAGMAGFLSVTKNGVVNPEMLSWHESGAVLMMIILGGLGSLRGAVIGAAAFVLLKEFYSSAALLGPLAERWQLTLGLTMIAFVALMPKGLIGLGRRFTVGGAHK